MSGAGFDRGRAGGRIALAFVVAALFMRLLVPAGWMPASERGLAITLCTGTGAQQAWVDGQGKIHKGKPGEGRADHPCVFAGFAALLDLPSAIDLPAGPQPFATALPVFAGTAVAIGRGLAAPPPPSTGPPIRL
ncbi:MULTISPECIES: hypothetical protein [unclassified Sphingomonas]|uniref:hypothetical protein n=1 Tax=unclassified Sphingomonas TaxID=196159 RepID=UPI0006FD76E4|nr:MULTISPECIES: hypothetical protein [unclassified Sphingomonas]KQX20892.1 hypothetical protein ASD17_08395 [Sphingomonas sp. Root1294]KQY68738.1 hypothetical protein ASD39_04910 [Sphingomonas sp. Root50]KRB88144.1 hypothetical protein ASE22_22085 [Sphingomonas sp. Root720]